MEVKLSTNNEAIDLLWERFASLGFMISSCEEKKVHKEPLPPLSLQNIELLYFFGLQTGSIYFFCKNWLKQDPKRKLIILEDDLGIICSFLKQKEAVEILKDPQVYLEYFSKKEEEIEALASRFPVQKIEFASLKSKGKGHSLRLKFFRKTALLHALHYDRLYGYQPFYNFVENLKHLPNSFYANNLRGAFQNVPAIVCGAGPSLMPTIDTLKNLEDKALIIAGGSTLAALSSRQVMPHFGVAIDPNLEEYRRFRNSFAFDVPLLYSTRVHPGIFQTCNGPFGYMRSGIGGALELWMEEELGLQDRLMGSNLPNETVSVTAICVAWAEFLGCNPILLNGIDMAYTQNQRYAGGVVQDSQVQLDHIESQKSVADRIIKRKGRDGKYVATATRWIMESANISQFAKKHKHVQFINTTVGGIGFKGIDYVPLEKAVAPFLQKDLRKQVFEAIKQAQMDRGSEDIIREKLAELKQSLQRVVSYLKILSLKKKGSVALAEIELKEEIAFFYLFYDINQIFAQDAHFWENWRDLAQKYLAVLEQ